MLFQKKYLYFFLQRGSLFGFLPSLLLCTLMDKPHALTCSLSVKLHTRNFLKFLAFKTPFPPIIPRFVGMDIVWNHTFHFLLPLPSKHFVLLICIPFFSINLMGFWVWKIRLGFCDIWNNQDQGKSYISQAKGRG